MTGGTLRLAGENSISNLDYTIVNGGVSAEEIQQNLFNDLVKINADLSMGPDLATSWDVSPDATSYTFHLRQGVLFHDGTPFNAQAVMFQINRIVNTFGAKSGFYTYYTDSLGGKPTVTVIDDMTVQVVFPNPDGLFITKIMSIPVPHMNSPTAVQNAGSNYGITTAVGTGPFLLVSFDPTTSNVVLARNPNYYVKGRPYLDGVTQTQIQDPNARAISLESGQIDYAMNFLVASIPAITAKGGVVTAFQYAATERLVLACMVPPTDDPRIRQAISLAVDRNAINQAIYNGQATPCTSIIPPVVKNFYDSTVLSNFQLNVTQAKALVQSYMSDKGLTKMTPVTFYASPGIGDATLYASIIVTNLTAVGIPCNIQIVDFSSVLAPNLSKPFGQHNGFGNGFFSRNVPGQDVDRFLGGEFVSGVPRDYFDYKNPQFDTLTQQFRSTTDQTQQAAIVKQMDQIINTDMPCVYFVWPPLVIGMSPKVQGFVPYGLQICGFMENIWLSK